jgi:hypothetical protein
MTTVDDRQITVQRSELMSAAQHIAEQTALPLDLVEQALWRWLQHSIAILVTDASQEALHFQGFGAAIFRGELATLLRACGQPRAALIAYPEDTDGTIVLPGEAPF